MEAAGIGAYIGFLNGMESTAQGVGKRMAIEADPKANVLDPLGITSLDDLFLPNSPLQDRLEQLEDQLLGLEETIGVSGGEIDVPLALQTEDVREQVAVDSDVDLAQTRATARNAGTIETRLNITSNATEGSRKKREAVVTAELNPEIHGTDSVVQAVRKENVVVALTEAKGFYTKLVEDVTDHIESLERQKEAAGVTAPEQNLINDLKLEKRQYEVILKAERDMAKDLKSLLEDLRGILGEGSTIFLNNTVLKALGLPSGTRGSFDFYSIGGEVNTPAVTVASISLNTEKLLQAAAANEKHKTPATLRRLNFQKAAVLATTLHEFGHAVGYAKLQVLFQEDAAGTITDTRKAMLESLRNDYNRFIRDNLNASTEQVITTLFSLPRALNYLQATEHISFDASISSGVEEIYNQDLNQRFQDFTNQSRHFEYIFSFREFIAEEISKSALGNLENTNIETLGFFTEAVTDIKETLAKAEGKFRANSPTVEAFFNSHSIRRQIANLTKIISKRFDQDPMHALFNEGLLTKEQADRLIGERDKFNWFMDVGFNIYQIMEQNPDLQGGLDYIEHLEEWKNEVNHNIAVAQQRLISWRNLGRVESESMARSLFDETIGRLPDGGWLTDPRVFTQEELATYNLSEEALLLRNGIKDDFRHSLNEMEKVLVAAKKRIFASDVIQQTIEVAKVKKEFQDMRSRPYFPLMRFGDYIFQVRSKGDQVIDGREYKDGAIVDYQTFDTQKQRDKTLAREKKTYVSDKVTTSVTHRVIPSFSLQGMPLTLLEHLESKLTSAQHSTEVNDAISKAIAELKNDALPFKSFRKQFQRRKRVEGFSMDAQRAYANYMTSFSNHIARVKFDHLFKEDFDNIQNSIDAINRRDGGDSTKRAKILNHMNAHLEYVMNPVNEFVGLRSAAFFWFLGFNVKSAFVNLTQIPLVTYPYLAARFGDGKAVAQITRAYGTALRVMTHPDTVDDGIKAMIEKGLAESWLDESLATELALAASENNLEKTLPRNLRQKAWLNISHYGSLPFHIAEKFNRHITAIAAYRLEKAEGGTQASWEKAARNAVRKTQFEYARYARPPFMRGKVGGTVFVFQNYMQNALYFALGGDAGAFRMIIMLFMMSGVMGIPFAENIADLIDAAMTALKRRTGQKDPLVQIRVDMRKILNDLDVNPDLILHGMISSTFGLANMGEFMGWPIPNVDLSGSLSMGRIIPGTQLLQPGMTSSPERFVKGVVEFGSGAIGSANMGILSAAMNDHPDQWKRWEKAMFSSMRNISKAARYADRGEEATRSGYPIADFDMHDPRDRGELVGQMLGFTPRELSKGWEGFIAQQQAVIYYSTWKTSLLVDWNYAKETKDKEAVKSANAAIRQYNKVVPFGEMKIGAETRIKSYESYINKRQFNARKIEQNRSFRRLSSSIEAVFEDEDNEDN